MKNIPRPLNEHAQLEDGTEYNTIPSIHVAIPHRPPAEEPPNEPKRPPVEEPGEDPDEPPPQNPPPVEEPPNEPGHPPVKEPPSIEALGMRHRDYTVCQKNVPIGLG